MARGGSAVVTGIGDDAAVLRVQPGHELLVTTDFSIEGVHFRRDWHPAQTAGWRTLARGLSDIAAMGGEPAAAFLSLAAAGDVSQPWIDKFLRGFLDLAARHKVPLAGGDTAQATSGIQVDVVVVGSVPRGKAVLRSGAKSGDRIYVTGELGGAAWALSRLRQSLPLPAEYSRSFRPEPRIAVGRWLRQQGIASAMIDISDGLSTDLGHICEESGAGALVEAEAIPRAAAPGSKAVALEYALHGGDDYELLFTSAKGVPARIAGVPVTAIGRIRRSRGMVLVEAGGARRTLRPGGWEHFAG